MQSWGFSMPSLRIRELPDDIYQLLSLRAQQEHRSLAQQALVRHRGRTSTLPHTDLTVECAEPLDAISRRRDPMARPNGLMGHPLCQQLSPAGALDPECGTPLLS